MIQTRRGEVPALIALCGGMRAGKDTVAEYLAAHYGYDKVAFGEPLRTILRTLYPKALADREEYRRRMQDIGQHMRAYDPDVWVRPARQSIRELHAFDIPVVVTDMRQPNEFAAMKEMGAVIVRVDCPFEIRSIRAGAEAIYMTHDTESHYKDFATDFVLSNDGPYTRLYRQVDVMLEKAVTSP